MELTIHNEYPAKFHPIVDSNKRWLIPYGGRGSGKSWSVADVFVTRTIIDGKTRLCTRHVQKSIKDSVHKLLSNKIKDKNLGMYFDVQSTTIKCYNGGEFIFKGMNDLGSLEDIQDAWVEEGQHATKDDIDLLIPTIRNDGSQIAVTYNPRHESDPVHQIATLPEYEDMRTVVKMNWRDNPWFPEVLKQEKDVLKKINYDLYSHIWEGGLLKQIEGALIKPGWFQRYTKLPTIVSAYIIADTASEAKEDNDYNVYLFVGKGIDGKIYLIDQWRGKVEAPERIQKARDFWNKHKRRMGYGIGATDFKVEKASSGFDLIQHLKGDISISGITRKRSGNPFVKKFGRLMDVIIPISEGLCLLPQGDIYYNDTLVTDGAWVDDALTEYQQFTADDSHNYDDQVDVLIDAVAILGQNSQSAVAKSLYGSR